MPSVHMHTRTLNDSSGTSGDFPGRIWYLDDAAAPWPLHASGHCAVISRGLWGVDAYGHSVVDARAWAVYRWAGNTRHACVLQWRSALVLSRLNPNQTRTRHDSLLPVVALSIAIEAGLSHQPRRSAINFVTEVRGWPR